MNGGFALDVFEIFGSVGMEVRMPEAPMLRKAVSLGQHRAYDDTPDLQIHCLQRS
jgi:hypothetical protein